MHIMRIRGFALVLPCLLAVSALAQGPYKVEKATAAPAGVPAADAAALQATGWRVVNGTSPFLAIWLTKKAALAASPSADPSVAYGTLDPGSWLGELQFLTAGSDFRGQAIKPGLYSLRYGLRPEDGNHQGTSTYRDFLVLLPASTDTDPSKALSFRDMVKMSRAASGTNHPQIMSLVPTTATAFPAVGADDSSHTVLQVVGPQPVAALGLVIVGQSDAQ